MSDPYKSLHNTVADYEKKHGKLKSSGSSPWNRNRSEQQLQEAAQFYMDSDVRTPDSGRTDKIGVLENLGRGKVATKLPFVGTIPSVGEKIGVRDAALRIGQGDYDYLGGAAQRERDQQLTDNHFERQGEESRRGKTITAQAGSIVAHVPAFVTEMAATGGVLPATAKAGSWQAGIGALKLLTGKGGRAAATKQLMKGVGITSLRAGARLPYMQHRVAEGYVDRQMPQAVQDEQGQITGFTTNGEDPYKSFLKAQGDTFVELMSEEAGAGLGALGGGAAKRIAGKIGATKAGKWLNNRSSYQFAITTLNRLRDAWGKQTGGTTKQFMQRILTKGGYNGILEEVGEERLGDVMRAVTGIDDFGTGREGYSPDDIFARLVGTIPNKEQWAAETLAFAAIPFGQNLTSASVHAAQQIREKFRKPEREYPRQSS
ncbi:hypothetical protein BVY04_03745 [bacterium M21]|nr:hypothetical protein BVY04_03745 [bacterium M21]